VQIDNARGDVQEDIAHGDVQRKDDLFTQSLKEIINNHDIKGKSSLEIIYSKLKEMLEPTSIETGIELPTAKSDVAKKHAVLVNASCEDNTLTYVVLQNTPIASTDGTGSARNIASGSEDVSAFVKRQRLSQGLYRFTERNAKERKIEGKNPFLVDVSKDGEPIGPNAARWASELGTRCRAHLDITKSNFADQDPRSVENVIQKMENSFETVGGQISRKYYKSKMRLLMNNYRYNCRKLIIEGKDRTNSTLSPKEWEALKETMCSEEYLTKRNIGMSTNSSSLYCLLSIFYMHRATRSYSA
jgi:hypothetical protein